jgi:hypothetical protein
MAVLLIFWAFASATVQVLLAFFVLLLTHVNNFARSLFFRLLVVASRVVLDTQPVSQLMPPN